MKRVAVFGATGGLGRAFCDFLDSYQIRKYGRTGGSKIYEITAFARYDISSEESNHVRGCDLIDPMQLSVHLESLAKWKPDLVIHAAGINNESKPMEMFSINVVAAKEMYDRLDARFLFVSSICGTEASQYSGPMYTAVKHAQVGLHRQLVKDGSKQVVTLMPGPFPSKMTVNDPIKCMHPLTIAEIGMSHI